MLVHEKISGFFDRLPKWKRRFLTLLAGAIASLALPPANIWPALFVAFSVLVFFLDSISRQSRTPSQKFRAAFACGWQFGFGYFVVSLYWIGAAFLVDADKFAILLPFAVAALPAGIALFWGLATGFAILAWTSNYRRILILAVAFTLIEWVRGHVLTGFPWNTLGYSATGMGNIDQLASFSGLYGVTFFVLISAMAPSLLLCRRKSYVVSGFLLISFVICWFAGAILKTPSESTANNPIIRIVQPNIEQKKKWDQTYRRENIEKYFQLSQNKPTIVKTDAKHFDALIWPESALPMVFGNDPLLQSRIANLLPQGSILIMGALRHRWRNIAGTAQSEFLNSVLAIDSDGQVVATYDKFHLVPFGEYLPGEKWLKPLGLRKIVTLPGGFASGQGPQTLKVGTLPPFSALICYEIGFSGQIVKQNDRPKWIINVTNDGWFGKTAGPHQHLAQARFRAIEQGLPVVRAANTGISAVIDANGKIIASLELGKSGVIQTRLPSASPPTVYSRYGELAAFLQIIGMLIILILISKLSDTSIMSGKPH